MAIKIAYTNNSSFPIKSFRKLFAQIASFVYEHERLNSNYELSVTITDDETIKAYNKEYRGIDCCTDVLSFALLDKVSGEKDIIFAEDTPILLGDIVISSETARRQALEYGHSFEREMAFLFVHGLLHLLGYDHMTKNEEEEMFSLQEYILDNFNIKREMK